MTDQVARISESDLAYHRFLLAQQEAARAQAQAAQAAVASWSAYLAGRYGLEDGDGVTKDGVVVRAVRTEAPSNGHAVEPVPAAVMSTDESGS